jgi:hypothetical protein
MAAQGNALGCAGRVTSRRDFTPKSQIDPPIATDPPIAAARIHAVATGCAHRRADPTWPIRHPGHSTSSGLGYS